MTTDEFYDALSAAPEHEREALAMRLLAELSPDDRVLVESMLGDTLASMSEGGGPVIQAPPGLILE